jgi:hypothetical protein
LNCHYHADPHVWLVLDVPGKPKLPACSAALFPSVAVVPTVQIELSLREPPLVQVHASANCLPHQMLHQSEQMSQHYLHLFAPCRLEIDVGIAAPV